MHAPINVNCFRIFHSKFLLQNLKVLHNAKWGLGRENKVIATLLLRRVLITISRYIALSVLK